MTVTVVTDVHPSYLCSLLHLQLHSGSFFALLCVLRFACRRRNLIAASIRSVLLSLSSPVVLMKKFWFSKRGHLDRRQFILRWSVSCCIGTCELLTVVLYPLISALCLRISGGVIWLRTGSQSIRVTETMRTELFSIASTSVVWGLLSHTSAQYSAEELASPRAEDLRVVADVSHEVPHSF